MVSGFMSEALIFLGGMAAGVLLTAALVTVWPWVLFLKRDE